MIIAIIILMTSIALFAGYLLIGKDDIPFRRKQKK